MTGKVVIMYTYSPYLNGEWTNGNDVLDVTDLSDRTVCGKVDTAGPSEVNVALSTTEDAVDDLRETTAVQRAEWMENIATEIKSRSEHLSEIITREAGKPISSARSEVTSAAERFRRAADEVRHLSENYGGYREGTTPGHEGWKAIVQPEPVGVVLCITPYNYPLATTALQVAPALAAGNAVVVKPASKTPLSAGALTDIISSAIDLPNGAFSYLPGYGDEIGDLLAKDDRVNTIAMTGSTDAGTRVASESGIVNLHLELGGNAPAIIFPDSDLETAVDACASSTLKFAGQRCSAISRILVHEEVHDEFVTRLEAAMADWVVGDLFDANTTIGPLISEAQASWVEDLVEDAIGRGARLMHGGNRNGINFEPTLLASVPQDARILTEEQFGPVAAVTSFSDESQATETANDSNLSLDAAVFTSDYDRALRIAEAVEAGSVRINGAPSHGIGDLPYGGNSDSGIGREGINNSIESMIRTKTIVL